MTKQKDVQKEENDIAQAKFDSAKPMTKAEHNEHVGEDLHTENLDTEGYLVKDKDGERWLSKEDYDRQNEIQIVDEHKAVEEEIPVDETKPD